ncbi:MAG: hypothetical protein QME07_06770 [bacterium]|nr:hypothetical protein [bacterium]
MAITGAVIETMQHNTALSDGAEKFLKIYTKILFAILLYGSLILYFLGTLSFRANPWAILGISASPGEIGDLKDDSSVYLIPQ